MLHAWCSDNEDDSSIPERIPVAIEGPFTDSEIVELVNGGSI